MMHPPAAARGETVRDALSVMRKLRDIFRDAAAAAPKVFPKDDLGYLVTFVGRKT